MPSENQSVTDGASVTVQHFYRCNFSDLPIVGDHHEQRALNGFSNPFNGPTIRNPNDPDHLIEDLAHLHMYHPDSNVPILDPASFANGYKQSEHPVEFVVRDSEGRLKQRIHTANIRTNLGGKWQGHAMFGPNPSTFQWATAGTTALQGGTYTAGTTGTYPAVSSITAAATGATAPAFVADTFDGQILVAGNAATLYYGVILTHTANTTPGTTTPTFYVDRWHILGYSASAVNPSSESSATVPTTGAYTILPSLPAALYIALSSDSSSNVSGGLSLSGNNVGQAQWLTSELTTSGMGRALATLTPTTDPSGSQTATVTGTYKLQTLFTATGGATVGRAGVFNTATPATTNTPTGVGIAAGNVLIFESILASPATLVANDTLQCTWTFTF